MRAIVTVTGRDRVGIIAAVCTLLSENNINILDISQTVMQEYFTMFMLVDLSACPLSFDAAVKLLDETGEREKLSLRIQREDIFEAMHRL